MDDNFCILARLAEASCQLGRFDDGALRNLFARRVTHDDVRTGIVAGVHPEIVGLGHAKSEIVVITRRASDKNLVSISGKVTTHARDLFRFGSFLLRRLSARAQVSRNRLERLHLSTL